ncbi:MAG: hypothetical protein EOO07_36250 [Chitinophagaceae bacterium]|nr:MAG: hypothetical protein EOO07_36250 [Chitinophagaceae bacterium]
MQALFEFSEFSRIPVNIPFGKHKGERILNLPQSYKNWLLGLPNLDPYLRQALEAKDAIQ